MNEIQTRIIIWVVLIGLLSVSGIVLRRMGRPYKTGTFTVHKLCAIGAIIFTWKIFQLIQSNPGLNSLVSGTLILVIAIAALSTISGALQSFEKPVSKAINVSHKIISYFLILLIVYKLTSYF